MTLRPYRAVRFEDVLSEGRTHPVILACRPNQPDHPAAPMLVKAIGCPEVTATRQLVAEVVGNATARRMGVPTPEPCIVYLEGGVTRAVNQSLRSLGYEHTLQPGPAAGCELLRPAPAPYTVGQSLTPEGRTQAARMYVFDMLSQNPDRRREKVNCGLTRAGLTAFDFEMCFMHLFLPIIGGLDVDPWEPSKAILGRNHLFYEVARNDPLPQEAVEIAVLGLSTEWWKELSASLPEAWSSDAAQIGRALRAVADHPRAFAIDIHRSLF